MKQRYKGYIFYFPNDKKLYLTDSWRDAKEKRKGKDRIYEGVNSKADIDNWLIENKITSDNVNTFILRKRGEEKCIMQRL